MYVNWVAGERDVYGALTLLSTRFPKSKISRKSAFRDIPQRLWQYLVTRVGCGDQTWAELSDMRLRELADQLKAVPFQVTGKGQFKDEFVTCGGVSLNEINFKTMESRLCPGLHVVGELLDIDGETGGFNFQNAWTTGYLAGTACLDATV